MQWIEGYSKRIAQGSMGQLCTWAPNPALQSWQCEVKISEDWGWRGQKWALQTEGVDAMS